MAARDFKVGITIQGTDVMLMAIALGISGTIGGTVTDGADYPVPIPFNMTLQKMKVFCKTAPAGAMVTQLRRATSITAPTFSDVTGFATTHVASQNGAVVDPTDVDINENDVLNLSIATGSGANLLAMIVGKKR
jgi:hypothetical protein